MLSSDHLLLADCYTLMYEDITAKIPKLLAAHRNLEHQDILDMVQYDPTGNRGEYIPWMTRLASKNVLKFPEDGEKVKETLNQFIVQKKSPEFTGSKDILTYKTYGDLAQAVDKNQGKTSKTQATKIATEEGISAVYTDNTFIIYKISTQEGASKMCRHTKWCIKDPKYGSYYLDRGPLFMIAKNNEPYVLVHFETGSIKDVYDKSIDKNIANEIKHLVEQFPQYKRFGETVKTDPKSIRKVQRALIDYVDIGVMGEYIEMEVESLMGNYDEAKTTTIYDIVYRAADGLFDSGIEMLNDDPESNGMSDADLQTLNFLAGDFSIFSNQKESLKLQILEQQVKDYFDSNQQ